MAAGEVYGKYHLMARVATGGMAEVFLARSSSIGGFEKYVAIKRMHPRLGANQGFVSLFIEEAKLTVSLTHPNVVQIFDFGRVDDNYFIAMEYVEGVDLSTLATRARERGVGLTVGACLYIVKCLFDGMAYAHTKRDRAGRPAGIIHRDISPHNVLVSYEGQVKISDFGIAKAVEELKRSEKGEVVGKCAYMSPEQARGEVIGTASDVWGGGVILHELLANARLFPKSSDADTLAAVQEMPIAAPSTLNPDVPAELDRVVLRLLDRDLSTRPSSAREVASTLNDLLRARHASMDGFALAELIRELYDGEPPMLLAALERATSGVSQRPLTRSGADATIPLTASGVDEPEEREPTRSERSDPAPSRRPRPVTRSEIVGVESERWAVDPFTDDGETVRPSAAPPVPEDVWDEVERLKAIFASSPNLWVLVDIGETYEGSGLDARALGAFELAAAKFAQQGLLVQAVAIYCRIIEKIGATSRVLAGLRRLQNLPGLADGELMLEILDPGEDASDFSEYHGLFEVNESKARVDIFAPAPIFSALGANELVRLVQSLRIERVPAGETIIREGDPGESFYWIGRGRVVVSAPNFEGRRVYLTSLADGDCFGEQSFFTGKPREATVEAMDEVLLIEVDKKALDELIAAFPKVEETLRQFYKDRIAESLIARSSLFGSLSIRDRRLLAARFSFVNFAAGARILEEGEDTDAFYAIKAGRVRVASNKGVVLAELGVGDVFGEMAALKGIRRTASVDAIEDCELLRLEAATLNRFLDSNSAIKALIEAQIAARADDTKRRVAED